MEQENSKTDGNKQRQEEKIEEEDNKTDVNK